MKTGIYKVTNNINDKVYVGLSKDIDNRWKQHKDGKFDPKTGKQLYNAMQDRGEENFTFEILELCPVDKLVERENFYIKQYDSFNNGYNASWGGEGASKSHSAYDKYNLGNIEFTVLDKQVYEDEYIYDRRITRLTDKLDKIDAKFNKKYLKLEAKDKSIAKINKVIDKFNSKVIKFENRRQPYIDLKDQIISRNEEKFKRPSYIDSVINKSFKKVKPVQVESFDGVGVILRNKTFQRNNVKYREYTIEQLQAGLLVSWKNIMLDPLGSKKSTIKYSDLTNVEFSVKENNITLHLNSTWDTLTRMDGATEIYEAGNMMNLKNSIHFITQIGNVEKILDLIRYEMKL